MRILNYTSRLRTHTSLFSVVAHHGVSDLYESFEEVVVLEH